MFFGVFIAWYCEFEDYNWFIFLIFVFLMFIICDLWNFWTLFLYFCGICSTFWEILLGFFLQFVRFVISFVRSVGRSRRRVRRRGGWWEVKAWIIMEVCFSRWFFHFRLDQRARLKRRIWWWIRARKFLPGCCRRRGLRDLERVWIRSGGREGSRAREVKVAAATETNRYVLWRKTYRWFICFLIFFFFFGYIRCFSAPCCENKATWIKYA